MSTYLRTGNHFKNERIEITDEINDEDLFKFDMNNVAAQAGSFQECKAVRLNLKEQRVLNCKIKRMNSQIVECERSKQVHIRLMLLHYEKLQKRISQLKSALSADELAEIRQLEVSGQLGERPTGISFNSARIIAMAYRRIYHQPGAIPLSSSCRRSALPPQEAAAVDIMSRTRAKSAVSFSKNGDNDVEEKEALEMKESANQFRCATSLGFHRKAYPDTSKPYMISRAQTASLNHAQSLSEFRPKSSLSNSGHVHIYQDDVPAASKENFVPYKGVPLKFDHKLLKHRAVMAQASLKYRARNSQLIIEEKSKLNDLANNQIQCLLKTVDEMKLSNSAAKSNMFHILNK